MHFHSFGSAFDLLSVFTLLVLPDVTLAAPKPRACAALPKGKLPSPAQFKADNGTKWTIEHIGDLKFAGALATQNLQGDKGRSSVLGGKPIWNFGDMECSGDPFKCGFAYGPAFYGTNDVLTVNTTGVTNVAEGNFVHPYPDDMPPSGMAIGEDTTNVAALDDGTGVVYAWEGWRNGTSFIDRGLAAARVTLGAKFPTATRSGPLITGPNAIQLGLLAILRDGNYVYTYSVGGPSGIIVGRVPSAGNAAFDASEHQFLIYNSDAAAAPVWSAGGIPTKSDNRYGVQTAQGGGFGCGVYGSVFKSNYLNQYVLVCTAYTYFLNFYVSDNPWGPWSAQYQFLNNWHGYGSHAHPEFSPAGKFNPGGSNKVMYISEGPNTAFNMFKITLNYDT